MTYPQFLGIITLLLDIHDYLIVNCLVDEILSTRKVLIYHGVIVLFILPVYCLL